jgi:predicted hydrolase (HD superfamily)
VLPSTNDPENLSALSHDLFDKCEQLKQNLLSLANDQASIWLYRQELLDHYAQLILFDLDYALEKKIEHDLWTIVFKNEMNFKQEQLKVHYQHPTKRTEIQNSLQTVYEYARGYYLKLLQVRSVRTHCR